MMPSLLENLRETNHRLHAGIESVVVPQYAQPAVPTPEQMAALLSELQRAGAGLRQEPVSVAGDDPALNAELEKYRCNVERLRDILPSIHDQLLAEQARIEGQRARVQSAAEWARASRQTL